MPETRYNVLKVIGSIASYAAISTLVYFMIIGPLELKLGIALATGLPFFITGLTHDLNVDFKRTERAPSFF